jgi:hypothetical protein
MMRHFLQGRRWYQVTFSLCIVIFVARPTQYSMNYRESSNVDYGPPEIPLFREVRRLRGRLAKQRYI